MDQLVQCPVCTLFLHNGMSLESHLDTHPKDQVIKALCNLSKNGSNFGSRTSTPLQSERSYRSRSRTPATEDGGMRWSASRNAEHDRYWRRTPSRTPRPSANSSRVVTPSPEVVGFDGNNGTTTGQYSHSTNNYAMKVDKMQQTYVQNPPLSEFDQQYVYYPDANEDRELKYSRSAEYSALDNANNVFTYNMPSIPPGVKLQTTMLPAVPRRANELVKILPKPNNILVKTSMGGVQYLSPGKPVHIPHISVVPTAPTFVQKNVQNNMIMTGALTTPLLENKSASTPLTTNQFGQISSGTFTPGTTVVTQNSQIIYREMVHNIDGKPFISSMPTVLSGHDNVGNVAQTSSMYQMVVDQFGNASCMYPTPTLIPKACNTPMFSNNSAQVSTPHLEKNGPNLGPDVNKTLVIEVGPIVPTSSSSNEASTSQRQSETSNDHNPPDRPSEKEERPKSDTPTTKGLKILSNIKVEVPVQHSKNMLNTIMDLTGPSDTDYQMRPISPERILPDLEDNKQSLAQECTRQPNTSTENISNTFSVIKNVGNPSNKDASKSVDNKIDTEFSDSCPVPDLICNEKPSISPCSELSEHGDNSTDRTSISPKPQGSQAPQNADTYELKPKLPLKVYSNPLRLNNIYVKKNKKVLQIKNAKSSPSKPPASTSSAIESASSSSYLPENFTVTKFHHEKESSTFHTVSIERLKDNDDDHHSFDANTEEQSMDIEPVPPSNTSFATSVDVVQVKEEINTSNEGTFSNEASTSEQNLAPLETLRPINVITYGNMPPGEYDDESNHRELLELEASSKNKQFVNLMNENYFGDYADYFTPDRVESFEEREVNYSKDGPKDGMYLWGEPSQKQNENEFVLPNFIHESYKIAESNHDYEMGGGEGRDSKADVLSEAASEGDPPLNICADERMPPRGELSGQESNGDMDSAWTRMYTEVTPAEPYDLIARESWVSDGSDVDPTEKRDTLEDELHFGKPRVYTCTQCGGKFPSLKELRGHKVLAHAPACSSKTSYSRMVTARSIKKEERSEDVKDIPGALLSTLESKESVSRSMLQVYDALADAKPKLEALVKQEPRRRRRDFVCRICKVDQVSEAGFQAHLKVHPLECLTCGKCFFRRSNLALHMKMHLGIKNYKCEVCEKRFRTRQKLAEHHNVHTGRAPVKCTVCDRGFRRYSNMVQHRDRHHFNKKTKVRDFVCHCGAIFHSRAKLHWHKETHDEKPKACLYCSDKFVHSSSLTRHVRRTHNEYYVSELNKSKANENASCPVCKQVYLRSNLRAHLLTHSGKRPYLCIICNKSFTTKWNLKLHRWTHMSRSSKPFKCTLCKGAFIRQSEYIAHMNAHKSVRPYTCNYCGCQFIRKYNCQRHVREHEMAKKYVCKVPECGKSFHRSYYLSEHMKVHSGARPFSCSICGKTSSNKSNHNKHVKIHHAREPIATEA